MNDFQTGQPTPADGPIAYFAKNPVAANLLMVFVVVMGLLSYLTIKKQLFPTATPNFISIQFSYPGAYVQELEEHVLVRIEEVLKDIAEIDKVVALAERGKGRLRLKLSPKAELGEVLDKVKLRVDSIANLPAGMEPLMIAAIEPPQNVMEISLVGDYSLAHLKVAAKKLQAELLQLQHVSLVDVPLPAEEISVEVEPTRLREFNLTLRDISNAISQYSANFSAGQIQTQGGNVSIRIQNQALKAADFAGIPVKTLPNSGMVRLRDVAQVKDVFIDGERYLTFSGTNAVSLIINATKEQDIMAVADSVKRFIEKKNQSLPDGLTLKVLVDYTYYLDARLSMMLSNLVQGAILVAIVLGVFLRSRLAFWVMVGLPVCFLGTVMCMPLFGLSINIVTLFAFIMVLGIIVDDAIVTAESVYTDVQQHGPGVDTVIAGVKKISTPVTFGVLTTMAIFMPFVFSSGPDSAMFTGISLVAMLCLFISLIESKLMLPAHLAHIRYTPVAPGSARDKINQRLDNFVAGPYQRLLDLCIRHRWRSLLMFVVILVVSLALISSQRVRVVPNPSVPHDFPSVSIQMNDSVSVQQTIETLKLVEQAILAVDAQTIRQHGQGMVRDILAFNDSRTEARLIVPLVDESLRPYNTFELSRRWQQALPPLPGIKSMAIQDDLNDQADDGDFGYRLYGQDMNELQQAAQQLVARLKGQPGVTSVNTSVDTASSEIQLVLKPAALDMGLTLQDVAAQVGFGFYGKEAQRVLRGSEETKVMVRYPQATREQLSALNYAPVKTPQGADVLLGDIATLQQVPGVGSVRREQGLRNVYVWGALDKEIVSPGKIVSWVDTSVLPELKAQFPGIRTELGGAIEEQSAQFSEQMLFFVAGLLCIYILLAVPLRSYSQPLIVMLMIPLSFTGAVWGHYWFGLDFSTMSVFGLIAAAGVVINDALVMTDYINGARAQGMSLSEAAASAGKARFRAVLLTSLTTFVGVLPLMFETSLQAKLMVPMAVGLGFAVMYATVASLLLVPALYLIVEDLKAKLTPAQASGPQFPPVGANPVSPE